MKSIPLIFLISFYGINAQDVSFATSDEPNKKIEDRIVNAIIELSSSSKPSVALSIDKSKLPQDSVKFTNLNAPGGNSYSFQNVKLDYKDHSGASSLVSIVCDSLNNSKIQAELQGDFEISADLKQTSISDATKEGFVIVKLNLILISKQFPIKPDSPNTLELSYSQSELFADIPKKELRSLLYDNLKSIFDQVELPLKKILSTEVDAKLSTVQVPAQDICSKFQNLNKDSNNFNNLKYEIKNAPSETIQGSTVVAKYISINGLASFQSVGFIDKSDAILRIKTNGLEGKVDWSVNSVDSSPSFSIDYIEFIVMKYQAFSSVPQAVPVNVQVKNISFKSMKSNDGNLGNFLTAALKNIIANSLKELLAEKLKSKSFGK